MIPRGNASSSAFNVPMALHDSGEQTGGLNPKHAKSRNSRNVQEAEKFILGPMPIQDFLDTFLQDSASDERKNHMRSSRNAFHAVPQRGDKASDITKPLLTALRSSTKYRFRCPGFSFQNTSVRVRHTQRLSSMKPDIICFASHHLDAVKSSSRRSRTDLGYTALFVDVKPDPEQDFFNDPPSDADADARDSHQFILNIDDEDTRQQASRALGQHISYVTEVCARQHRTFCYSISMAGSLARLIRWDRAGAIVTESFDIRQHPGHLCEFLWRFSQVSDVERGYDPTVGPASEGEEILFREAITSYVKLQLDVEEDELGQAVREHYKRGAVSAIHVTVKDGDVHRNRRFIVSRPVMSPLWPVGRGTRGYWAVDADSHQVVFLKDTWRYDGEDDDREGNILEGLNDLGVRYIPTVICHGDIPYYNLGEVGKGDSDNDHDASSIQSTLTHRYKPNAWVCGKKQRQISISTHVHYRVVEGKVGYDLKRFKGTNELLHATYDVFQAMIDASEKARRIHRDISLGNIILVKEPDCTLRRGYLADWEVSCKTDSEGLACNAGRAGTWQYMSSNALVDEDVVQTLQDDMESLFYVVLYCSLRWLPHSDTDESVSARINALFHHSHCIGGQMLGGDAKISLLRSRAFARDITWANAGVQQWVNTVLDYRSPQGHPNPLIFPESWSDPRHLDIFWGDFLTSLSREPNDRIERDLENSSPGSAVETSESNSPSVSSAKQDTPKAPSQGPDSAMHQIEPVKGRLTRSKMRLALQQAGPNKRASGRPTPSLVKGPIAARKTATPGRGRGTVRSGRGRGDQTKTQPRAL